MDEALKTYNQDHAGVNRRGGFFSKPRSRAVLCMRDFAQLQACLVSYQEVSTCCCILLTYVMHLGFHEFAIYPWAQA